MRVLKKFNWNFNFETKRLIRPINYLKFVPLLNKLNLNLLNSSVRYFIKKKFDDNENLKLFNLKKNFKLISDSFKNRKLPQIAKDFPMIERDESWLKWRLFDCPYSQNIHFFEYKNSFSIVHIYSVKKVQRLNVLFTYSTEMSEEFKLYKLITKWSINNNIDYIWAIHKTQDFNDIFPQIHKRPLRFASWSENSSIFKSLEKGFFDLQGIDSDIESAFYLE